MRFGMVHRNTYINGPTVLRETWQTRTRDDLFFAGQVSGVEGYVESAASGLIAGRNAAALVLGRPLERAAAHDGDRRAGVLRLARRSRTLPADQHHARHHGAARAARRATSCRRSCSIAERALRDLEAWHSAARLATAASTGAISMTMKSSSRRSSTTSRFNRNVSAHTVRAYESDITQYLAWLAAERRARGRRAHRRRSRPGERARAPRRARARAATRAARWRASCRRCGRSCAICGAKACSSTIPTALAVRAAARADAAGPSHRAGDGAAARDARRRRPARPPRSRDPRAVLRVGPAVERAGRSTSRTSISAAGWCA